MAMTENGLPFPQTDYGKNGNLKRVRGRVVKKLLKYEMKWYGKILLPCVIGLLGISLFILIASAIVQDKQDGLTIVMVLPLVVYVYAIMAIVIIPVIMAIIRYSGSFFKSKAYLTLTLPVSVEEHVLAKRLSACIFFFAGLITAFIGLLIADGAGQFLGVRPAFWQSLQEFFAALKQSPVLTVLEVIEGFLLFVVLTVFSFNGIAALNCFFRKFSGGKRALVIILTVFVAFLILQTNLIGFAELGLYDILYGTPLVRHISKWLTILLFAGFAALCVWFEIRSLKKKVNV